jgi:hypothetical protein
MKISDVTVTLFAWDDLPPRQFGRLTGRKGVRNLFDKVPDTFSRAGGSQGPRSQKRFYTS